MKIVTVPHHGKDFVSQCDRLFKQYFQGEWIYEQFQHIFKDTLLCNRLGGAMYKGFQAVFETQPISPVPWINSIKVITVFPPLENTLNTFSL